MKPEVVLSDEFEVHEEKAGDQSKPKPVVTVDDLNQKKLAQKDYKEYE